MSETKKRKADQTVELKDEIMPSSSRQRRIISVQSPVTKSSENVQFQNDRKSLYQQGLEQLNEKFLANMSKITDCTEMVAHACEYKRISRELTKLYNPTPGVTLACGNDDGFQLGISGDAEEDKEPNNPPTKVRLGANAAVQVACGGLHSLVLTDLGEVYSFGVNDDFGLGRKQDDISQLHLVKPITRGFEEEDHNRIVAIDGGDSHSIFLSISGNVYQCGMYKDVDSGKFSDVPIGSTESPKGSNEYPVKIAFPKKVKSIKAGDSFNAAIMDDGDLYTWGMGHFGELARSKDMGASQKTAPNGNYLVYDLGKMWIGEEYETYELDPNGKRISVMKYRYKTDLIKEKFLKPAPVCWAGPPTKRSVLSVACGQLHLLVVARDSGAFDTKVYSSGNNGYGQLGHGDDRERHELTSIKKLEGENISKVSAGSSHSLALDIVGTKLYAWGRSDYGTIGHTTSIRAGDVERDPVLISFPRSMEGLPIKDIVAGGNVSMAITEKNEIYTWGFGEEGAPGHAGISDILKPKKLDVLRKYRTSDAKKKSYHVLDAAAGGQHSLMIIKEFL